MKKKNITLQAKEVKQLFEKDELVIKVCLALKLGYTAQEVSKKFSTPIKEIESIKEKLLKEKLLELPPDNLYKIALQAAREDDDFASVLAQAQEYHKRDLLPRHVETLYQVMEYGMDTEVVLFLMETIQANGKYSEEYLSKIAKQWVNSGIYHISDIGINETTDEYYIAVKTSFGIHRILTNPEIKYIEKWKKYDLPCKIIKTACERTIMQTGKASFPYCDKILTDWQQKNVKSDFDVANVDKEYRKQRKEELTKRKEANNRNRNKQKHKESETTIIHNNMLAVQNMYISSSDNEEAREYCVDGESFTEDF